MKRFICMLGLAALFPTVLLAQKRSLLVQNPSAFDRSEAVVSVPWSQVLKKGPVDTATLVITGPDGKQLPLQFEKRGGTGVKNLLVLVSIKAKETLALSMASGKRIAQPTRTFARYVPERKDDFAWENDRVAFRLYGKALEGSGEDAQGMDVWAKRTPDLIVNKWYRSGDYHSDHGEGLDYYSVGMSLGAGDIAPFPDGKISYPKHYRRYEVLDNGPIRSTFRLDFDSWDVSGRRVVLTKTISIDAGSQLNRVEATFNFKGEQPLPVAVGIVQRKEPGGQRTIQQVPGVVAYWEPAHGADGNLAIGIIARQTVSRTLDAEGQLLTVMQAKNGKPVVYYQGAAWNKAGRINSANSWNQYLENFKAQLDQPLRVTVK
ncbi:DUF4861 domain-containing protein [Pedobacter yulinensis]|uniref:DUF4861 domain-containing protein n=1 Tax=Pedobacter yulinensis TaxID=2126353 RepID=A0A2T3HPK9_9SPHI|nr:DUF4861 family protein [Pedobacter yulinensis]PST84343.1 DUF4861 domain-containing protein [Pedobacter yulinensis]